VDPNDPDRARCRGARGPPRDHRADPRLLRALRPQRSVRRRRAVHPGRESSTTTRTRRRCTGAELAAAIARRAAGPSSPPPATTSATSRSPSTVPTPRVPDLPRRVAPLPRRLTRRVPVGPLPAPLPSHRPTGWRITELTLQGAGTIDFHRERMHGIGRPVNHRLPMAGPAVAVGAVVAVCVAALAGPVLGATVLARAGDVRRNGGTARSRLLQGFLDEPMASTRRAAWAFLQAEGEEVQHFSHYVPDRSRLRRP
jgi:hypothetical protein